MNLRCRIDDLRTHGASDDSGVSERLRAGEVLRLVRYAGHSRAPAAENDNEKQPSKNMKLRNKPNLKLQESPDFMNVK
jgi:hypothetical protein